MLYLFYVLYLFSFFPFFLPTHGAIISFNTALCSPSTNSTFNFNDPSIWYGGLSPSTLDHAFVSCTEPGDQQVELLINSPVDVHGLWLYGSVLVTVVQNGILNVSDDLQWSAPSIVKVSGGVAQASHCSASVNNGLLILENQGEFKTTESGQVGNASVGGGSLVRMKNLTVLNSLVCNSSKISVNNVVANTVEIYGSNSFVSTSLYVGKYALLTGDFNFEQIVANPPSAIDFINATTRINSAAAGTVAIKSSNITICPLQPIDSLTVVNSHVVIYMDRRYKPTQFMFNQVVLIGSNISFPTSTPDVCSIQILNLHSVINGNIRVVCGISFNATLGVMGNYIQESATYMNFTTSSASNATFLRTLGSITINGADIYKDMKSSGVSGTIRLAQSAPDQINATVRTIYNPFKAAKMVDTITINVTKGSMKLTTEMPSGPSHLNFFYEDWRYIVAAIILAVVALIAFIVAKALRRSGELDEYQLVHGNRRKEEDEEEEEMEEAPRLLPFDEEEDDDEV